MSKGLIKYSEILNLTLNQAIDYITNNDDRLVIDEIKLEDLSVGIDLNKIKFMEYDRHEVFGWGAYIVFQGKNPIYIGAAEKHFLHRFQSHLHIDNRGTWGWNALLFKLTGKKKDNVTIDDLNKAKAILLKYTVIRINLPVESINSMCIALERELMIGFKHRYPNSILNEKVRKINTEYLNKVVNDLVVLRSNNIEIQKEKKKNK